MILQRNGHAFPKQEDLAQSQLGSMENVGRDDPYSDKFVAPQGLLDNPTPYGLYRYLEASNRQKGFMLDAGKIPLGAHLKVARELMEEYDIELLTRAVWNCGRIAKKSINFWYVKKWLENNT